MSQTGAEGCVIIPSLKTVGKEGYVTKLFYNKNSKAKELAALELFKASNLDSSQKFTITDYDEQPIEIPSDIAKRCKGEVSGLFINYKYGGVTIKSILENPQDVIQVKNVINSLIPIAIFVDTMNKSGYYHDDLHSANIVYDNESRIIDFGSFVKKPDTTLIDDFAFGSDNGIYGIIKSLVNVLISNFGDDEINITETEHAKYTKFLTSKPGKNRQAMLDAITGLSNKGGRRIKTKRSKHKRRKTQKK
jgi:hypothetical protein